MTQIKRVRQSAMVLNAIGICEERDESVALAGTINDDGLQHGGCSGGRPNHLAIFAFVGIKGLPPADANIVRHPVAEPDALCVARWVPHPRTIGFGDSDGIS